MTERFDYFVLFAEMRTGSNFLESNLNALGDVVCHGEAFNPFFVGYPKSKDILGITLETRERNPDALLDAICAADGMNGFRYFHDHDARVYDRIIADPRCAKIVLTRNPAESYVSWKIAKSTGQWLLTDAKGRKTGQAEFVVEEFDQHVSNLQTFQMRLLGDLQKTGQTAFYISYEDLRDVDVINGLAAFLGTDAQLKNLDKRLKVQNPGPLSDKVKNFDDMQKALAGIDRFNLTRTPNFEPRRAAVVPTYIAGVDVPLIFLPIAGGPVVEVSDWLAGLQSNRSDPLLRNFTQKALRQWKRGHGLHRSFTVLRHPLARAHHVFCAKLLDRGDESFSQIRKVLQKSHKLELPDNPSDTSWGLEAHQAGFLAFLKFLKSNLAGQTSVRVDPSWATQSAILQGFANFMLPDAVVRETDMGVDLPGLAAKVGSQITGAPQRSAPDMPYALNEVVTPEIEEVAANAYQRDYMMFGFTSWADTGI
ncbi:MAG: nodulation protein NodH [Pseudomonadota bacterium]